MSDYSPICVPVQTDEKKKEEIKNRVVKHDHSPPESCTL